MKTFCIQTLGCKVNQYESEQIGSLLRSRGLSETTADRAELRIIHTCSVTVQAASQSRQEVRRMTRLPVLPAEASGPTPILLSQGHPSNAPPKFPRPRVLVTGCWATGDRAAASSLPGVDAVIGHRDDVAAELDRLLGLWQGSATVGGPSPAGLHTSGPTVPPRSINSDDGWMIQAGTAADDRTGHSKPNRDEKVNAEVVGNASRLASRGGMGMYSCPCPHPDSTGESTRPCHPDKRGTTGLPLLGEHQSGRQRAFLKVQDGCDAHCTYCIIPSLRPRLWSKSIDDAVEEARRLVACGHVEIVLTGIFLGAYGKPTALRRRQPVGRETLSGLVEALCTRVSGLHRLRLSSLEPGDLTDHLLSVLRSHRQVVPHFHLPLQSGSDHLLRQMNRQYTRTDFLRMLDRVRAVFDEPALTTDIIVGFPGETDEHFEQTVDVAAEAQFIHIHAFPFSPRPGTAAARWQKRFVRGPVVNERLRRLRDIAQEFSFSFRRQFVGRSMEVVVEQGTREGLRHGRCDRYFDICFAGDDLSPGELVDVRVDHVHRDSTVGTRVNRGPR